MEQKWHCTVTYLSIDDIPRTYKKVFSLPYDANNMFKYIMDYMETGKWADEAEEYEPTFIEAQGRSLNALTHARWFFLDHLDRYISWEVAMRCLCDTSFAEKVLEHASSLVKSRSDREKKDYRNARRCIREHKKKGKESWMDYCFFVNHFDVYKIIDFDCEFLGTI